MQDFAEGSPDLQKTHANPPLKKIQTECETGPLGAGINLSERSTKRIVLFSYVAVRLAQFLWIIPLPISKPSADRLINAACVT